MEVNNKLNLLMTEFQSRLPHKEGLLLRPELRKTLHASQQKKLAVAKASQLQSTFKRGRKRADAAYRNREGKKAQAFRKVRCIHGIKSTTYIHFLCTHDSRYFLQAALKTLKKYKKAQTAAINNSSTASSIKAGVHQHDFSDTYILILPYYSPNLGSKRKRCYSCSACLREDCGTCKFCVDKPKYGGPGKKK